MKYQCFLRIKSQYKAEIKKRNLSIYNLNTITHDKT